MIDQLSIPLPNETASASDSPLLRRSDAARSGKIMIVDDEPINVKVVQKYLRNAGFVDFITTTDATTAIETIRREMPDVILLDIMMPQVSGIDVLEVVRGDLRLAHIPILILTATSDDETKELALNLGATDFLNKPVKPLELVPRVKNAMALKAHQDHLAAQARHLDEEVRSRTKDLSDSREELIRVLACAAEYRDNETGNHVIRVGKIARILAIELGFSEHRAELISQAATLHDVGKIGITDRILLKPGKLTDAQFAEMRKHCQYGWNILRAAPEGEQSRESHHEAIRSPVLKLAAMIAISHHEKWDGTGYPDGIRGEEIPIEGRITAVADVFDALSSRRPYKEPFPLKKCFEIISEGRGKHFDPRVVDALATRRSEVIDIATQLAD